MPVENTSANGFREISEGLIVCNSCGKVHQLLGANRKLLKCEACGERFLNAPTIDDVVEENTDEEMIHYELDCPECETHFEIDLPSGPLILDCGECGCSFTVEEKPGFRKSGSQSQAAEAVGKVRTGKSKKARGPRRASLSISKQKEKHPWLNSGISFIAASVLCVGIVVYIIMMSFEERAIEPRPGQGGSLAMYEDLVSDDEEEAFSVVSISDFQARAFTQALEGFVSAPNLITKSKYCRYPGITRVRMDQHYTMEFYEAASLENQERVDSVQMVVTRAGQQFIQTRYKDKNGVETTYVAEVLPGDQFAFEWEPTVLFSEITWGTLENELIDRPVTSFVRVQQSTRYNSDFPVDKYASYYVFHESPADGIVAYTELGSETEEMLSSVFEMDQFPLLGVDDKPTTKHVMLKLEFPREWNPDEGSKYGRILEVVQMDWVRYEK